MMHIIPNPAGRFAFVGSVPAPLAFNCSDPDLLDIAAHSGPGFARKVAVKEGKVFETRSFASLADAEAAALEWAGSVEELAKHYRGAI
jgi:hypothetical protein